MNASNRFAKYLFGIVTLLAWSLSALAKPVPITLDPQNTVIAGYVHNDNVGYATGLLQKWLRKIYKTEIGFERLSGNQVTQDVIDKKVVIAFGPSPWGGYRSVDEVGSYGFTIQRKDNVISIVGAEPGKGVSPLQLNDMMLAATYFLDHFCGVRIYMPNDLFGSLPAIHKVIIPATLNVVQKPFTENISATGFANNGDMYEFQWARHQGYVRKNWESHQHSMYQRFPPGQFAAKYPEIYPVYDGKRYIPQSGGDQQWQPDFAEPHLVDAAVESAIAYFKEKPALRYIAFSVQDSHRFSKEGKMGEALKLLTASNQSPSYTDLYIKFINEVATRLEKELPKNGINERKTIVYLAYSDVNSVPKEKLHPDVLPVVVFRVAEIDMKGGLFEAGGKNPASVADWLKVTKRIGIHDWAQGQGYMFPRIYPSQYSKLLRFIREQGGTLEFAHIECYPNWGLDGPKYYLMSKVLWDPATDVSNELTQFCNDMFGRASKEMNGYFTSLEQLTLSMNNNPNMYRKLFAFPQQLLLTEADKALVTKARGHLDKATKLARTNEEKQRIALFSKTFKVSEYLFEVANAKEVKKAKLDEITKYVNEVVAPDRMTFYAARNAGALQSSVQSAMQRASAGKVVN